PATSGVTGSAALGTPANQSSPVGTYPITIGLGSLAAANYSFSLVGGRLAITLASSTYTWNSGAGTLAITLASNASLTISEAAGTRSFALSSGTLTQSGGNTATGDGSPTISFAAGNDISNSISVANSGAGAG